MMNENVAVTINNENLGQIGLALSGGGARAIAFHLGCLRALHNVGILQQISVISSVSGGSVIAALYCSHPGDFDSFELKVKEVLKKGFLCPAIYTAFTTLEGVKAVLTFLILGIDRLIALIFRCIFWVTRLSWDWHWLNHSFMYRYASRTTILRQTFSKLFNGQMLTSLRSDRPSLIIIACELRARAAFYFTSAKLHCWRYGSTSSENIEIADAVAASAAYPLALPAIDQYMNFEKNGIQVAHRITLTDGGVYDNLGLNPLFPGRDPTISLDAGTFDRIIACRAGYALQVFDPASFVLPRMTAAFESVFARAQNFSMNRLYDLKSAGKIKNFLLPYLGQKDDMLKFCPNDLITEQSVADYPTNFSAMKPDWIDKLSKRGEQLVYSLLKEHWPELEFSEGKLI